MSEIDIYKHECIGMVHCPSSFWPPPDWYGPGESERPEDTYIPLYLLYEDALDADSFEAKHGDLLLGGGSGESPALRISMPEALLLFTDDYDEWFPTEEYDTFGDAHDSVCYAYWSMNDAFLFCEGYAKLGWRPNERSIELWLAEHILAFVLREYPHFWGHMTGQEPLDLDGSICRLPTEEEKSIM